MSIYISINQLDRSKEGLSICCFHILKNNIWLRPVPSCLWWWARCWTDGWLAAARTFIPRAAPHPAMSIGRWRRVCSIVSPVTLGHSLGWEASSHMWHNPSQAFLVTSYLQLEAGLGFTNNIYNLQFVETEEDQVTWVTCLNNLLGSILQYLKKSRKHKFLSSHLFIHNI